MCRSLVLFYMYVLLSRYPFIFGCVFVEIGDDTCDSVPTVFDVPLAAGCSATVNGSTVTTVDVGECVSDPCVTRTDTAKGKCCAPVLSVDVEVDCDIHSYTMKKITACGCGECEKDGEIEVSGTVSVRKTLFGKTTIVAVNASLHVTGNDIDPNDTSTFGNGLFSFSATPEAGRISIRFYQNDSADFLPQVVSVEVPRGASSVSRVVVLQEKPEPVPLNASLGGDIRMSADDGAPTVTIPANSIVDANGDPYEGTVNVYPTFADPRDLDSISSAPGEFSFDNEEGEKQDLQTQGVLGLFFQTADGQPLRLSGKTTLTLDPDNLGIGQTEDGEPDSYAWTMDADTGKWKMAAPLEYVSKRRKRATLILIVSVQIIIPYPLPYINLDKPALKRIRCTLIVQVYADALYTQPLADTTLQVVTMTPDGRLYIGYTMGYTNYRGRACVTVMCGYRHMIVMKPLLGQAQAHPTHHLPAGFSSINVGAIVMFT